VPDLRRVRLQRLQRVRLDLDPPRPCGCRGRPVKIRLTGLPDEVMAAAERLADVFDLVETSDALPCRGNSRQVRVYTEVRL
jgi:hypothetical protein